MQPLYLRVIRRVTRLRQRARIGASVLGALLCWATAGAAAGEQGSLLLGGGGQTEEAPVRVDPRLPKGARIWPAAERPVMDQPGACSPSRPVCVHQARSADAALGLRALSALERAYDDLVLGLELPVPLLDRDGGSPALDLYLSDAEGRGLSVFGDARRLGGFDRQSGFCVYGGAGALERAATTCLGELIALRLDAGVTPHLRRAYATHLWWAVGRPDDLDLAAVADVQAHPERAIATRERTRSSEGAALLLEYLDRRRGSGGAGTLSTGLIALAANQTPPGAWLWHNEPDVFDVLRRTLDDDRGKLSGLLGDFAVSRGLLGGRGQPALPELGFAGPLARARVDWTLPLSSLPRRVAATRPVEPGGASFVWVPLDGVITQETTLGMRAHWEPPVAFRWEVVKLDRDGRELSRLSLPFREKATEVEQRIGELAGAAALLIVGTNLGGVDLAHPFDPDVAPFEPHAYTLYLAKL